LQYFFGIMDDRWSQVWESLVATPFGLYTTWEEKLQAACGIPALHFHVLQTLAHSPDGRLRLQELAEAVRHSQSGTTRLVDRLEKEGLVARHSCDDDRRVTWAMLSEKGKLTYEKACPVWFEFLADHLRQGLTEDEADQLHRLLHKLQSTLAADAAACPAPTVA
jgi:DNA-binding MarR family transcriptional regulator